MSEVAAQRAPTGPGGARSATKYVKALNQLSDEAEIEKAIRQTFQEAQRTVAVHKTQVTVLKAIMNRCRELGLADDFNRLFCMMVNKILAVKRNEPAGDRIVKYISSFTTAINPASQNKGENEEEEAASVDIDPEEEHAFSEFIGTLTKHLVRGMDSSNKDVRYRVCHLLSHLMHNMSSIDKELYDTMSEELLNRIYDKDPGVRVKAITTLASFQEQDGSDVLSDAAKRIRVIMQNDPKPEVRRACLRQLEKSEFTNSYLFERARDVNPINRRMVFSHLLPAYGDFRTISSTDRNKLLAWGLRDREENVRKAAVKWLTDSWLPTVNNDILEFVERLKVTSSEVADIALRALLDSKPQIAPKLTFNKEVLENLTSEYALLLRVFFQYCNDNQQEDLLDTNFTEAAQFADVLKLYFDRRRSNLQNIEEHKQELEMDPSKVEEYGIVDPEEYDYVILQLLLVASEYDYHDEFGRSKMLNVLRSILSEDGLSEKVIDVLIQCISKLSINERDFSQIIVEIINDARDSAVQQTPIDETINSDESEDEDEDEFVDAETSMSRASIRSAKSRQEEIERETKQVKELPEQTLTECLTMCKRMLELVNGSLKDNMYLESILHALIRPALQRSEVPIRVLALTCMGLCCVLDKDLAVRNMFLCGVFITKSDNDELIMAGLKVIADLLAVHGVSILDQDVEGSIDAMAVAKLFYRTLRDSSRKEVQAVSGEALYKLFLSGIINDDELFETTLLAYFNPTINDNEALKQCLSFCIPVYAFSHPAHQEQVSRVVSDTLWRLFDGWDEMEEEANDQKMISPQKIVEQLVYWTDPYRVVNRDPEEAEKSSIQVDVAVQLLKVLTKMDNANENKSFIKAIFSVLPKLTFTEDAGATKLDQLYDLLESDELLQGELEEALHSAHNRNSFERFREYVEVCLAKAKGEPDETKPELDDTKQPEQSQIEDSNPEVHVKEELEAELEAEPVAETGPEADNNESSAIAHEEITIHEDTVTQDDLLGQSSFIESEVGVKEETSFTRPTRKRKRSSKKSPKPTKKRTRAKAEKVYDSDDDSIVILSDDE